MAAPAGFAPRVCAFAIVLLPLVAPSAIVVLLSLVSPPPPCPPKVRYRISTGSITSRISGGLSKKYMAELTPVLAALKADNLSPVLCAALRVLLYSCIMLFAGNPATIPPQPASAPAVVVHAAAVQSERCCMLLAACVTCCLAFFRHFIPKLLPLPPLLLELLHVPSQSISK